MSVDLPLSSKAGLRPQQAADKPRPLQFSVRSLARLTAVISIVLAVWRVGGPSVVFGLTGVGMFAWARRRENMAAGRTPRYDLAGILSVSTWFSLILVPAVSFLVLLASMVTLLWYFRVRVMLLYVLVSPLGIPTAQAFTEYWLGVARLRAPTGGENLRRELRVFPNSARQCIYSGGEWAYTAPYDLTLIAMVKAFGTMPGAYSGSYPTEAEAKAALEGASEVPLEAIMADRFVVAGTPCALERYAGQQLILRSTCSYLLDQKHKLPPGIKARVALHDSDCMLIGLPVYDPSTCSFRPRASTVVLVDRSKGRRFATYDDY